MSGEQEKIVQAIKVALDAQGTLTGTRAAEVVRTAVPGFTPTEYGFKSIREFVLANVPGLAVVARAGMDVVYGFGPITTAVPEAQIDLWRVWASPNSPKALVVRVDTGSLRAVSHGMPLQQGEELLVTPPSKFHLELARQFVDGAEEPLRSELAQVLTTPESRWWEPWTARLAGRPELQRWYDLRKQSLLAKLRDELKKVGVADAAAPSVIDSVVRSHAGRERPERSTRADSAWTIVREVVSKAVRSLPEGELREIRLPVGAVVDALRELGALR